MLEVTTPQNGLVAVLCVAASGGSLLPGAVIAHHLAWAC
nr:MAG TPA_asm: hypothetical protein [Caudoviricetes sp.]